MRALAPTGRPLALVSVLAAALSAWACATNPVTGESEFTLVSEPQEIAIGLQQYGPARQMQGGDYAVDAALVGYVQEVGSRLAAQSPRPGLPYEFRVLDNTVPNAWALPGGKIAVNRGLLLALEDEAQLAAVLGHEIVHAAARHGAQSMERQLLLQGALGAVAVATAGNESQNFAMGGAALGAQLVSQKYGRGAELEADEYGMRIMAAAGYDPAAAIDLQQIFVGYSLGRETSWLEGLFASHPPSPERVEANRATLARLAEEGSLPSARNATRFREATAHLRAAAPALAEQERGRAALAQGDAGQALRHARAALEQGASEPRTSLLEGDALLALGRPADAEAAYSRAIELDAGYFGAFLQRGFARRAQGLEPGAREDLERSLALLPTEAAHVELGELALRAGERDAALAHFEAVASSDTEWGHRGAVGVARLELPHQPERFIVVSGGRDRRGFLVLEITNTSPIAVEGITVEVVRPTPAGPRTTALPLPDRLAPGQHLARRTNLGPFDSDEALAAVGLRIAAARPAESAAPAGAR